MVRSFHQGSVAAPKISVHVVLDYINKNSLHMSIMRSGVKGNAVNIQHDK